MNSPEHKRGFIFRALSDLWLDAATRPYYTSTKVLTQSNAFRVQVENGLDDITFSFCIFRWFQSSLTYHDICGPHWWLRSYSSQASAGCKLKAECLFLICLEPLFSLYYDFWHIFRSADKVS